MGTQCPDANAVLNAIFHRIYEAISLDDSEMIRWLNIRQNEYDKFMCKQCIETLNRVSRIGPLNLSFKARRNECLF